MSLKPNTAGLYNIEALNVNSLYIAGVPFTQFINDIQTEDQLDNAEIAEIQAFLARLDITGLTGNLILTDANRNATLLTAIQNLQTKTTYLDTTALTQTWIITNDNRNASLKTSIDNLQTKTNLLDTTALTDAWVVNNTNKNATLKSSLDSQAGDISALQTKTQYITSSANTININAGTINIGQFNALVPSTQTNLRGDIYTNQAYFKSLNTSSIYGWTDFITLFNSTNLPAYVASAVISSILDFMPSDVLRMNGSVSKSGDVQTTNDVRVQEFKMFNTSVIGVDILSKFLAFMLKGNATITTGLGDIALQTFSGHAFMRNNNISTTAIDWAVTEQRDKCNIVSIQNNDILIHLGGASGGSDIEVVNSVGGDIIFKTGGTNGLKSSTQPSLRIKYANNFLEQIEMGWIDPALNWGTNNSKLFVSQLYNQTNGITVGSPDVYPATNHKFSHYNSTHANTGALILQDNYLGSINKAIYTAESGQKLFYSGTQIYPPLPQNVGGVGITFLIQNPSSVSAPATLTMSETYVSQPSQTVTLSSYNNNTNYLLATIRGAIPSAGNPVISGIMQHDQWLNYISNQPGQIWDVVNFRATSTQNGIYDHPTNGTTTFTNVLRFVYPKTNTTAISNPGGPVYTSFIPVSNNSATLTIHTITIPYIALSATGGNYFVRLELVNAAGSVIHTFTDVAYNNSLVNTINFGGTLTTINITNTTAFRFKFTNLGLGTTNYIQTTDSGAQGNNGLMYIIHGSASQVYSTLLHDGVNNKTTLTNNSTANYILTLPIATLDVTQLYEPNIQIETRFIQPTGTTTNHSVALLYNDGYLSHLDSTFSTTTAVPTIAQVLASGNNASNLNITSLGTISPSAITGWNVKEITGGTNISRSIASGTYTINNSAPVQDAVASSGISISKANNVATITNTGIITATAGSNISVSVANNNLNITNTANVTDVIAGNGITISTIGGTATISQSVFQAIGNANDLSTTDATISYGQKAPLYYGARWRNRTDLDDVNNATLAFNDIVCNSSGRYLVIAPTNAQMRYSTDYGNTFTATSYSSGTNRKWISLAMSADGQIVYALGTTDSTTSTNWRLHYSTSNGVSWTERGTALGMTDITTAVPVSICCSADGKKILFTDARAGSSGKVYYSGDSGTNFDTFSIASGVTLADDCAMSSNGQIQFITTTQSTGGITHAAIYRSSNFGNTWTKAYTKASGDSDFGNIDCDTTGRIVVVCRKGGGTRNSVVISLDYGVTWTEKVGNTDARSVAITPNGFRIWFGLTGGLTAYSDNWADTTQAWDTGSGVEHNRICCNINGTVVFTMNSTSTSVLPRSYIELRQINEIANQHYFSYTTNILKATGQTHQSLPVDMDLENYEYHFTFDFEKVYYDRYIYLGFNGSDTCAFNYNSLYYHTAVSSISEALKTAEYNTAAGNVFQAYDASYCPIMFSPTAGNFFYCSCSITYRFYAPSSKILIMERMNPATHYRTFNSTQWEGRGTADSLANNTGCDFRTIRGRIEIQSAKIYLPDNNAKWSPTSFQVFYTTATNVEGTASVKISNIERKAKNTIVN